VERERPPDSREAASTPRDSAGGGDGSGGSGAGADSVLIELEKQLKDLHTSSDASQSRLQAELDSLRVQKREEEAVRQELKAKARALEEARRLADVEHAEAEKKLRAARNARRTVEDRIDKMKVEIVRLEKKEREVSERACKARKEREEKEARLREAISRKKDDLIVAESQAAKVAKRVEALESSIEARKAELAHRRETAGKNKDLLTRRQASGGTHFPSPPHPPVVPSPIQAVPFGLAPPGRATSTPTSPTFPPPDHPAAVNGSPDSTAIPPFPFGPSPPHGPSPPGDHTSPFAATFHTRLHHPPTSRQAGAPGSTASGPPPSTATAQSFRPMDTDAGLGGAGTTGTFAPFGLRTPVEVDTTGEIGRERGARSGGVSFAGLESPSSYDSALSPMMPHQASLIPSQLFEMLDGDGDVDVGLRSYPFPETIGGGGSVAGSGSVGQHRTRTRSSPDLDKTSGSSWASAIHSVDPTVSTATSSGILHGYHHGQHHYPHGAHAARASLEDLLAPVPSPRMHHRPSPPHVVDSSSPSSAAHHHSHSHSHHSHLRHHRHPLSLNPDAKAFSFNRPLPVVPPSPGLPSSGMNVPSSPTATGTTNAAGVPATTATGGSVAGITAVTTAAAAAATTTALFSSTFSPWYSAASASTASMPSLSAAAVPASGGGGGGGSSSSRRGSSDAPAATASGGGDAIGVLGSGLLKFKPFDDEDVSNSGAGGVETEDVGNGSGSGIDIGGTGETDASSGGKEVEERRPVD
jgi:hypothetical protein